MRRVLILGLVSFGAIVGFAVGGYSPVANLTERWTNGVAGWVVIKSIASPATNTYAEQSLVLAFSNLTFTSPSSADIAAVSNSSGGIFVGNYSNSAIESVAFDVKRIGLSTNAEVGFTATNRHVWKFAFKLPTTNDNWEHREVPLTYSTNWLRSGVTDSVDVFNFDRSCVSNIKVTAYWAYPDTSVQQLRIDNFKVVGPWEKGPFWSDGVPKYWLVENGLTNQEGMASNDWDNDGFNNFGEYMAGTDPKGSNSLLKVTINKVASSNAVTLSWPRADYRTYKVLLNTNLTVSSYQQYTGATYQAVGATNKMTIRGLTNGPKFFKVEVDK